MASGTAVLNADDLPGDEARFKGRLYTSAYSSSSGFFLQAAGGVAVSSIFPGRGLFSLLLPGALVSNALAALAIGYLQGVSLPERIG